MPKQIAVVLILIPILFTGCFIGEPAWVGTPSDEKMLAKLDEESVVLQILFDNATKRRLAAGGAESEFDSSYFLAVARDPKFQDALDNFFVEDSRPAPAELGKGVLLPCRIIRQTGEPMVEKGYAVLEAAPYHSRESLDVEPADYKPGTILLRHWQAKVSIYYVRHGD